MAKNTRQRASLPPGGEDGAAERNRTSDPVLTKDVLYRLSYGSSRLLSTSGRLP